MKPLDNIMGVEEASELWGLAPGYIKNLCANGSIECKKIGKTWVIDKTQPNPKQTERMSRMREWNREGYKVVEEHAGQFEVIKDDGEVVGTIVTGTAEDREQIIADLDAGEDVNGWEDGAGNTIYVD